MMKAAKRAGQELSLDACDMLIFTLEGNTNKHGRLESSKGIELDMATR
jgi:hypothetical protein